MESSNESWKELKSYKSLHLPTPEEKEGLVREVWEELLHIQALLFSVAFANCF